MNTQLHGKQRNFEAKEARNSMEMEGRREIKTLNDLFFL